MRARHAATGVLLAAMLAPAGAGCGNDVDDAGAEWPRRDLKIMAPADPGGGWDTTAREMARVIEGADVISKNVEVYNVTGAGGTIGLAQLAAKRKGEANQMMVMGLVMLGAIETNQAPLDIDDTTPIAALTTEPEAIVVRAESDIRDLKDLVERMKADPSKVSFAGGSAGGTDQILLGLLAKAGGVDPSETKYIAYSGGGEANQAILSGSVSAGISGASEFEDQIAGGKMRVLAVSTEEPVESPASRSGSCCTSASRSSSASTSRPASPRSRKWTRCRS
jgi:putative tricarboxylic transport membrane protein